MAQPCPACLDPIAGRRAARCSSCKTKHHEGCWIEFGGCMACGQAETVRAARRKQPRSRMPMAWVPIVVFYIALQGLFTPLPTQSASPAPQAKATAHAAPNPVARTRTRPPRRRHAEHPRRNRARLERPRALSQLHEADTLLRYGQVEAAYWQYKTAVDENPRCTEAVLGCARTALRAGHFDRANYWLRYARELKPRSKRLARLQQRLEQHLATQGRTRSF